MPAIQHSASTFPSSRHARHPTFIKHIPIEQTCPPSSIQQAHFHLADMPPSNIHQAHSHPANMPAIQHSASTFPSSRHARHTTFIKLIPIEQTCPPSSIQQAHFHLADMLAIQHSSSTFPSGRHARHPTFIKHIPIQQTCPPYSIPHPRIAHRCPFSHICLSNAYASPATCSQGHETSLKASIWETVTGMYKKLYKPFQIDSPDLKPIPKTLHCPYNRDKDYLFDIKDQVSFFDSAQRSRIVEFILRRKHFSQSDNKDVSFGIKKMIADGHFAASYPLHEGHWKPNSAPNRRKILFDHWANWKNFLKIQPLGYVQRYFGVKVGLYFAWLGFYTAMLVPASVMGVCVFIYGLCIMNSSTPNAELCDPNNNITMCPLCDRSCPYWKLSDACDHVKVSRIVDNRATVAFAVFMSLWGTLFLEFWKRKEAVIAYKWDMSAYENEEEPPRPEYLAKLSQEDGKMEKRRHPVTGKSNIDYIQMWNLEPHIPFWSRKVPVLLMAWSTMLFLVSVAVVAVIGVIAYRISILAALQLRSEELIYKNASLVTTATAAIINLVAIIILNMIYSRMAFWLTDMECLRTQSEYDNSITLKLFTLQFVNYYSSIVYIAFFKGRFVGRPGKYNTLFGARQEECEPGGCLIELCIQLAIIMIGKQLIQNNLVELVIPKVLKRIRKFCAKQTKEERMARTAWERDFQLNSSESMSLFYEYLEMVLQFGFLTLFVAAFPLAPLFALINNIIEIRLDANKFVRDLQRPSAERVKDIGIWYSVLYGVSRIAIISNAFILALTADFLPRLIYRIAYSEDGTSKGFWNGTLSYFDTSDFENGSQPLDISRKVDICRYRDFRNPPWHTPSKDRYEYSEMYWHIMTGRLAFVVVFENVVVVLTSLIAWMIPDMPIKLKNQIHRENRIINEVILKTELQRAQFRASIRGRPNQANGTDPNAPPMGPPLGKTNLPVVDDGEMELRERTNNGRKEHATYL
ncbi:anoctamin-1-like isoform X3 [Liolophura sinensis]|uniref:anoctamin-1-like isoform X3 n=1 Tax=Liolophura sinensis TaxID=3198878 RepID=UPI003158A2E8